MITEVLPKQNELEEAVSNLKNNLLLKGARRKAWNETVKNLIADSLQLIKDKFALDCQVQRLEDVSNYQTINISFNRQHTGIVEDILDETNNSKGRKAYLREGGYLAYSQALSGMVSVVIGYPTIKGITSQRDAQVLETLEPLDITEDHISLHVAKFLNEMSDWEMMKD